MTSLADAHSDDPATLKAMVLAERARGDRRTQILKEMQRHRFRRQAQTLPLDQLELGLGGVRQDEAVEPCKALTPPPLSKKG